MASKCDSDDATTERAASPKHQNRDYFLVLHAGQYRENERRFNNQTNKCTPVRIRPNRGAGLWPARYFAGTPATRAIAVTRYSRRE